MSDNQTKPTDVAVEAFIAAIPDDQKRADSTALVSIMTELSGEPAIMWGPAIIGFGSYHYVYESGRQGDMPIVGFSPRKAALTLYGLGGPDRHPDLIARLGKHTTGKGCVYIKRLNDVDLDVLRELIARSVNHYREQADT